MPIDIQPADGVTAGMLPIDLDLPANSDLKETIMGRSLTPPPEYGPGLGTYCTGDAIKHGFELFTTDILSQSLFSTTTAQTSWLKEVENDLTETTNDYNSDLTNYNNLMAKAGDIKALTQNTSLASDIDPILDKALNSKKQELTKLECQKLKLEELQQELQQNPPTIHKHCFKQSYQAPNNGPTIMRFGITPYDCIGLDLTFLKIHPIEMILYKLAQDYLTSSLDKLVLLDIFVRDKDEIIMKDTLSTTAKAEIHTIALWKPQPLSGITYIIDPNQRTYSEFLQHLSTTAQPLECAYPNTDFFYGTKNITVHNKKRDCIDIALKIGFELINLVAKFQNGATDRFILDSLLRKFSNTKEDRGEYSNILRSIPAMHSSQSAQRNDADKILTQAELFLSTSGFKITKKK